MRIGGARQKSQSPPSRMVLVSFLFRLLPQRRFQGRSELRPQGQHARLLAEQPSPRDGLCPTRRTGSGQPRIAGTAGREAGLRYERAPRALESVVPRIRRAPSRWSAQGGVGDWPESILIAARIQYGG